MDGVVFVDFLIFENEDVEIEKLGSGLSCDL